MIKKILFSLLILPSVLLAQHKIKGKFTPPDAYKFAFLYRVTAQTSIFVNNASINKDGTFEFDMDSTAVAGTYRLVYAQPQDQFNFDFLYNTKEDVDFTFDKETGVKFNASKENTLVESYKKSLQVVGTEINTILTNKDAKEKEFNKVFKVLKKTQEEFEQASKGTLAYHFIHSSRPYIPSEFENAEQYFNHAKASYFNNIDYSDPILKNSNFLIEASLNFVLNFIKPSTANQDYKSNVDTLSKAMGGESKLKKIIFKILWNQFSEGGNETVANYISDKHLLTLAKQTNDNALANDLYYFKKASIGSTGYDFNVDVKNEKDQLITKRFSDLKDSEYYLVFFWSTTCSHCLDEIPQLKAYIKTLPKNKIKVVAIALDEAFYRWSDMRYDYPDFIHVFGKGKWDNVIGNNYNVKATPSYFILDKNKKIIAKPEHFKDFKLQTDALKVPVKKKTPVKEGTDK